MPSTLATASGTAAGSPTAANSITHTPSGKSDADRAATSSASPVFPTPPTPVSVPHRCALTTTTNVSAPTSAPPCRPLHSPPVRVGGGGGAARRGHHTPRPPPPAGPFNHPPAGPPRGPPPPRPGPGAPPPHRIRVRLPPPSQT